MLHVRLRGADRRRRKRTADTEGRVSRNLPHRGGAQPGAVRGAGCARRCRSSRLSSTPSRPENVLKWEAVHPQPDAYNFEPADRYVAFGEKNQMFVIGHTLVWHSQVPRWVFQDDKGAPLDRDGC